MEYQFIHDPITGSASAKFSLEHQVIGPWLEVEVGHCPEKLTHLLTALDEVEHQKSNEITITGSEYSAVLSHGDVVVQSNASMNGVEALPEALTDEHIDYDQFDRSSCGSDDFRELLLSWAKFVNHG